MAALPAIPPTTHCRTLPLTHFRTCQWCAVADAAVHQQVTAASHVTNRCEEKGDGTAGCARAGGVSQGKGSRQAGIASSMACAREAWVQGAAYSLESVLHMVVVITLLQQQPSTSQCVRCPGDLPTHLNACTSATHCPTRLPFSLPAPPPCGRPTSECIPHQHVRVAAAAEVHRRSTCQAGRCQ